MAITAGNNALASDFINASTKNSTPANDSGRVAKLESNAKISAVFLAPLLAKQTTQQNSPGTTTETTVFSQSIAAGVLGTANGFRYKAYITTSTGGVSATTTVRLKLGSTTLLSINPGNNGTGWVELIFFNNGGTGAQVAFGTVTDVANGSEGTATGTGAESTTSTKTLTVTCQLSNAAGAYTVQFQTLEAL